jgi:hypothetical protein
MPSSGSCQTVSTYSTIARHRGQIRSSIRPRRSAAMNPTASTSP